MREAAESHMNLFQEWHVPNDRPWVWSGDFNQELDKDGDFQEVAWAMQGEPIVGLRGTATRWNSKKTIRADFAARTKWIKRNHQGSPPVVCHKDRTLQSHSEVTEAIRSHWQQVWKDAASISPLTSAERSILLKTCLEGLPPPTTPERPKDIEVFATVSKMKRQGASGPDGWSPAEVKALPFAVFQTFWEITARWEKVQTTPSCSASRNATSQLG